MSFLRSASLAAALALGSSFALADTLNFSYGSGPYEMSGTLTGMLQADGNTFIAKGGSNFAVGGTVIFPTAPAQFGSWDALWSNGGPGLSGGWDALVTLDGSKMDMFVSPAGYDGFAFNVGGYVEANMFSAPVALLLDNDGMMFPFEPSEWRASLVSTVPEPASVLMLAAGLAGLAMRRRSSR